MKKRNWYWTLLLIGLWMSLFFGAVRISAADFYIFGDSQTRYLTEDEISGLTPQILCYARNEIYARHGRMFQAAELQEYFGQQDWYSGTVPADQFSESVFNEIELSNIQLLKDREFALVSGGYLLDQPGYDISLAQPQTVSGTEEATEMDSYASVVKQKEALYGSADYMPDEFGLEYKMTGVCLLHLTDMDNNGQEELVMVYNRPTETSSVYWLEVWEHTESGVRMVYEGDTCYGGDYAGRGLNMTEYQGQEYIITGDFGFLQNHTYLGYKDGSFQVIMKSEYEPGTGQAVVDGVSIPGDEWQAEEDKWLENIYGWGFYSPDPPIDLMDSIASVKKQIDEESPSGQEGSRTEESSSSGAAEASSSDPAQVRKKIQETENAVAELEERLQTEAFSQYEMNTIAGQLYDLWDEALNSLWACLKETLSPEEMELLTQEETQWISYKNQEVEKEGADFEGGSMQPLVEASKAAELTKERVYTLLERLP